MVDKKYYKMPIKSIQFSSFLKNFSFEHKCGKLISESPLLPSPLEGEGWVGDIKIYCVCIKSNFNG
jgi:hypothetical protein